MDDYNAQISHLRGFYRNLHFWQKTTLYLKQRSKHLKFLKTCLNLHIFRCSCWPQWSLPFVFKFFFERHTNCEEWFCPHMRDLRMKLVFTLYIPQSPELEISPSVGDVSRDEQERSQYEAWITGNCRENTSDEKTVKQTDRIKGCLPWFLVLK